MPEIPEIFNQLNLNNKVKSGTIGIEGEPQSLSSVDEVKGLLSEVGGEGWICFADKLWISGVDGDWSGNSWGPVLCAELSDGDTSLHIRQDGAGWKAVKLTVDGTGDGWTVTNTFIRKDWKENESNITVEYEVGWEKDKDGIYRATRSRFIGFGGKS